MIAAAGRVTEAGRRFEIERDLVTSFIVRGAPALAETVGSPLRADWISDRPLRLITDAVLATARRGELNGGPVSPALVSEEILRRGGDKALADSLADVMETLRETANAFAESPGTPNALVGALADCIADADDAGDDLAGRYGLVTADQIEEEETSFLSQRPPIIRGALNLIEGNPDTGKTTVALSIVAAQSAGRAFPYGSKGSAAPSTVLFLTAEDSLSRTVVKRLKAAEADLARVLVQQPTGAELLLPDAVEPLRRIVRQERIGTIILDPLNAYLDASKVDVNKEQQVRQALRPLRDLAEQEDVTIIGLRHLNKASDKPALYRGGGSIALAAVARSVLLVARHPEDQALRVVISQKCNLVSDDLRKPIGFRIESRNGRPCVEWLDEEITIDADELLAPKKPGPKPETQDKATQYLRDHLASGPKSRKDILHSAEKVGLNSRAIERAAEALRVVRTPHGKERLWKLPETPHE